MARKFTSSILREPDSHLVDIGFFQLCENPLTVPRTGGHLEFEPTKNRTLSLVLLAGEPDVGTLERKTLEP